MTTTLTATKDNPMFRVRPATLDRLLIIEANGALQQFLR